MVDRVMPRGHVEAADVRQCVCACAHVCTRARVCVRVRACMRALRA